MVIRETQVYIGRRIGWTVEHVLSIAHASLRELVLAAEGSCVLKLNDAALVFCQKKKIPYELMLLANDQVIHEEIKH